VSATVELSPLFDPTLDRVGFPLDHPYIERVYCSVLGPTSVLLLRRAGELFADHPAGVTVDLVDLSRSLGLGGRPDADDVGRNAPLRRTMDRLARFHMARWTSVNRLAIHPKVPALAKHHVARLAEPVQVVHHRLLTNHLDRLVARAEGRELDSPTLEPPTGTTPTPAVERPEPAIAARLRAFGNNGPDPRAVIR
jgi:hypothetical protein